MSQEPFDAATPRTVKNLGRTTKLVLLNGMERELLGILKRVALDKSVIYYSAVAKLLGLNMAYANERMSLGIALDSIGTYCWHEWKITLNVLVVGKADHLPSGRSDPADPSGFYDWAVRNGLNVSNPAALVHELSQKAYARMDALVR